MGKPKDPRKVEMGLRIAKARIAAGLTQDQLAEHAGVTYQAVSRWEAGETTPRDKSVYQVIADVTKTTLEHILYGVEQKKNDVSLPQLGEVGQIVPSVAPNNVTRFLSGDHTAIDGYTRTHYPCGPRSFRTLVDDTANTPELRIGDTVVIDPDMKPKPEDFVAVLHKGVPTIRVFGEEADHYEFVPLNPRHATIKAASLDELFIGTISEYSKGRRR